MDRNFNNLFGLIKQKSVPSIDPISEQTRDAQPKAYIPKFIYKPPFGYPRFVDLPNIRRLAASPYVDMCISASIDQLCAVEWDIIPKEGKEDSPTFEEHKKHIKDFYENPNTNKESFEDIRKMYLRDVFEVDAGVINKLFNQAGEMVEIVARDGATFTKNPDIYGMMTDREDLLPDVEIATSKKEMMMDPISWINAADAREKAAYFQYGWISGAKPVPFGKKEIIWMQRNSRTDSIYGRSPVEVLANTIQTLIYALDSNLEYFSDNQIPRGIIGLDGSNTEEIKAFKDQWKENQRVKDSAGNWKKKFHTIPITNKVPTFTRLELTNSELELLEGQKWWAKLVWACFGVTSTELGYTEDAKGMSNQIVQSNVFKKRTLNPMLRMEEYKHNKEIISEFEYDDVEFKFEMFDVDEEQKKANLYAAQINAGWLSINEIRVKEGLEEVEWGEKQSAEEQMEMQSKFSDPMNAEKNNLEKQTKPEEKKEEKKEKKKIDEKSNPLILGENEKMNDDRLQQSIVYLLKQNEKKIKDLLEAEVGQNKLIGIKSVMDIIKKIKSLLSFGGLKVISDKVIEINFMKGWDSAEKQIEQNLPVNNEAVNFIQDYTFNNIKGMTDEIMNDLRQELERGIMAGEGISKLKARIGKVFDVGENRARMISVTESSRAENQGRLLAMKSSGLELKKYLIITHDNRTAEISKAFGRKYGTPEQAIGLDKTFSATYGGKEYSGQAPPFHVNDRDTVVFI